MARQDIVKWRQLCYRPLDADSIVGRLLDGNLGYVHTFPRIFICYSQDVRCNTKVGRG